MLAFGIASKIVTGPPDPRKTRPPDSRWDNADIGRSRMTENYFVSWKPQYSVHIDTIDSQHQALVAVVRQLQEAMWEGRGRAFQQTLIDRLVAYTKRHLRFEEEMLGEQGYEFLAEHVAQHQALTSQVCELQQKIHEGKTVSNAVVLLFLRN